MTKQTEKEAQVAKETMVIEFVFSPVTTIQPSRFQFTDRGLFEAAVLTLARKKSVENMCSFLISPIERVSINMREVLMVYTKDTGKTEAAPAAPAPTTPPAVTGMRTTEGGTNAKS